MFVDPKPKPQASLEVYATWQEKFEDVKMGKPFIFCMILVVHVIWKFEIYLISSFICRIYLATFMKP
jgi:hypothetical protein